MNMDPSTTKYMIHAKVKADGTIEKPDVVGAVFGQTEGLLGNEMDLRDLQKGARIGRVEVDVDTKKGKSEGMILVPSALDKVETAIIAAALEAIDRVGPCKATITVEKIEDVRSSRRGQVVSRAKELLRTILDDDSSDSANLTDEVRQAVQVAEIVRYGRDKLPAGPGVSKSEDIILVEGRNDVLNLLRCGIKNAISVEGTNVPDSVVELCKERVTTIFIDGDRGGELIARELLQSCEIDFVARAPQTREVEELPYKLVMKALNNRVPGEQFATQLGITPAAKSGKKGAAPAEEKKEEPKGRGRARGKKDDDEKESRSKPRGRGRGRSKKDDEDDDSGRSRGRGRSKKDDEDDDSGRSRGRGRSKKDDEDEDSGRSRGRGRGKKDDKDEDAGRGRGRSRDRKDEEKDSGRGRGRDRKEDRGGGKKKDLPPEQENYREILAGISGSLKAVLLDKNGKELKKDIAVRELAETLKNAKSDVGAVVFDGVVTQRLLDIASEKKIGKVVGVKVGNVSKTPDDVEVVTKAQLE